MPGPIRTVLVALENVAGTRGATLYNVMFNGEAQQEDDFQREILEVQNGTVEGGTLVALNGRESKLTINVPIFYDTTPVLLVPFLGLPVTADVSGDTAVKTHTFLRAKPAVPPTCSLLVYDNVDWWQITGAVGNTLKFNGGNNKAPSMDLNFRGPAATHVTAPTVPAIVSAYNPLGFRALEVDVNTAIADAMLFELMLDNQRNPRYTARRGAAPRRFTRGRAKSNFTMDFEYIAYTGSYREMFDNESNLATTLIDYLNSAVNIGTLPHHPEMAMTIPDGIISKGTTPTVNSEKTQHIEALANYNGTLTSGMSWVFQNLVTGYVPD